MEKISYYFFNFELIRPYLPQLWSGFLLTLGMAVATVVSGIALGLALAVVRAHQIKPINALIVVFIDIFRAIPQLVVIVVVYFALPAAGITLSPVVATVTGLALILAAFAEEIFWGGFGAIARGQWEAARSTGMSFSQALISVVLPQVLRNNIAPLTNRAIGITKGTALGSVIAVPELLNVASSVQSTIANPTPMMVSAVLFCLIFLPFVRLTRWLETHFNPVR
ncbi:MAG: amino acid ABC transporter permease [Rhodoferax sp.]|jgi:cystine transport system permease protein|uniref:amino acid ABC transporter permease n=1 Tax=Rhodoferax sp. TaxID=50421 RepID=UPI001B5E75A5|nr:amino acid ABC transporter permease [Rhodoferax sp.]MBP9736067.1 amino acid ABC transporter permease [Rhodoferax sp.]MBP9907363.1 amino acid ABC transporter permease [Rhodoferax sp.]